MTAFVLMTAMPPTTGHLQLIQFARAIEDRVTVLVCTQPHEPMGKKRFQAVWSAVEDRAGGYRGGTEVLWHDETLEQDPSAEGFWEKWALIMSEYGLREGDRIVASEPYGQKLAEVCGVRFMPYDLDRQLNWTKAEYVRNNPYGFFDDILPEFQQYLKTTVTLFGAESTGKSTLAKALAEGYFPELMRDQRRWLPEWARPYLEQTGNGVSPESMRDIMKGQRALQLMGRKLQVPLVIQDTDLYSTIGYWSLPHWKDELGPVPGELEFSAAALKSDLYLICPSNIPFEKDPQRYGGDKRESDDQYWIDLCQRNQLTYEVLKGESPHERVAEAQRLIRYRLDAKATMLRFDRKGL